MALLLAPTVGERLSQCGERVSVYGVVPGCTVTLRVGSSDYSETVTGTSYTFSLPTPLAAGEMVSCRQEEGSDQSEWSPEVEVEAVDLPPSPPLSAPSVYRCAHCLRAWGVAPGSEITLESGTGIIAEKSAGRDGEACLGFSDYPRSSGIVSSTSTCGEDSTDFHIAVEGNAPPDLFTPVIPEPVFACQTRVYLTGLNPGARVDIKVVTHGGDTKEYHFYTCWQNVNLNLGDQLWEGDTVEAQQSMARSEWDCNRVGPSCSPVTVVRPDERIKPTILEPVYEGEMLIQVSNQIEGGTITLYAQASEHDPEEEVGSRSSSQFPEVATPALHAGQVLRVSQELCEVLEYSDPVTVLALPATIPEPTVRSPLYACGSVVMVDDLMPGATVHLLQSEPYHLTPEYPIGQAWASGESQAVRVYPYLLAGANVRAYQVVGGQRSQESDRVVVQSLDRIPAPRVGDPALVGWRSVWVYDIVPGAYVRVFDAGQEIGAASVGTSEAWIPLARALTENSVLTARQMLCLDESESSPPVTATPGPCAGAPEYDPGPWNDGGSIQRNNNCYNYGCDIRNNTYAQPGCASGYDSLEWYDLNCEDVTTRALADGLVRCGDVCHPCEHKVALVIRPGRDFHWYRQDANGLWSHKMARDPVTNRDNDNNLITNPYTANRGTYTEFCGYFCVYKPDVNIGR